MNSLDAFNDHRRLLFSIAYRMLGTVTDAEDMVQETFLRWQQTPQAKVRSPKNYLATTITRLCIDHRLKSLGAIALLLAFFFFYRSFTDNTFLSPLVRIQSELWAKTLRTASDSCRYRTREHRFSTCD